MKNIGFDFEAHFASDRACQGGRGEDSGPWGRFLFLNIVSYFRGRRAPSACIERLGVLSQTNLSEPTSF